MQKSSKPTSSAGVADFVLMDRDPQPIQRRPSIATFEQDLNPSADYRLYNLNKVIEVKSVISRASTTALSTDKFTTGGQQFAKNLPKQKSSKEKKDKALSKSSDDSSSDMWKLWRRLQV